MRKALFAFVLLFANLLCLVNTAHAQSMTAGNIFTSMGGTVSIDQGGSIHSQARSIYSLGGGMATFKGKKVSLIAADPPGFSAGCSGISWHFGGFSFISMDEIRQLVEAVAQASLGVAIDLAMQTLCPQCYAVMSKLRDISNMMRNAAADACKIAQNFGSLLAKDGKYIPGGAQNSCAEYAAKKNESSGWFEAAAGSLCSGLNAAESAVGKAMGNVNKWLNGEPTSDGKTPTKEEISKNQNLTYDALKAMGYKDGVAMDLMLSFLGMAITQASATDCTAVMANIKGTPQNYRTADAATNKVMGGDTTVRKEVTASSASAGASVTDANQTQANTDPTDAKKGGQLCFVPPHIIGFDEIGHSLVCGLEPYRDAQHFAAKFHNQGGAALDRLANSSLGELCKVNQLRADTAAGANVKAIADMELLSCKEPCMAPTTKKLSTLVGDNLTGEYTGMAWMILDALYSGVNVIANGTETMPQQTIKVLSSSGYPLYRLLNMAAVYPGMADEMLQAYGASIALQYVTDTIERVARVGAQPSNYVVPSTVSPGEVARLREQMSNMLPEFKGKTSQVLRRMAEKRALVESIIQVNRALQAEVISRGLGDNNNMALSLRRQMADREARQAAAASSGN